MYVDGDTHYWPLRFLERVSHPGKGHVEVTPDPGTDLRNGHHVPGAWATYYRDGEKVHSFKEGRWNLDLREQWMQKDGFDVQVLIPDNRQLIYEIDPELGRQMARAYNDTVAEDIQGREDRFIGVAWVYLPDVQESIREARRAVEELGLKAIKLMGGFEGAELDDQSLWPFYEEAERLNVPLLVHPTSRIYNSQDSHPWLIGGDRFTGYRVLPTALGFPFTYMTTAARLIFGGVLDRFPNLRFAFFEGGAGWVPWLMRTLDEHIPKVDERGVANIGEFAKDALKYRERLTRTPSQYFEQLYIAAVAWEPYLAETVKWWPNHNIIIGSDFDHNDAISTWPNTVQPVLAMEGLSDEDKDKILGKNVLRLLGMEERVGVRV